MPIVTVESGNVLIGPIFDATLSDGDRRLRVQVRRINDRTLLIEPDDPPDVVSIVTQDGTTRFAVGR